MRSTIDAEKLSPLAVPDVPVVEVQSAGAEDFRGEVELLPPVGDDLAPEEPCRPAVHLSGDLLGDFEEHGVAVDGQLQVALVVERHRRDLAERVLAVEHPAVGAREQRVGDVAQGRFDRRAWPGCRAGALNPLPAKIAGDLAADELALPGVLHFDLRARDDRLRIEERHALPIAHARRTPGDARLHHCLAFGVERRQRRERGERLGREDVE